MADNLKDKISSLVGGVRGGRVADEILALIREHIKSAIKPEPRYASFDDEEIRDNYVAGFVTGRYRERQSILGTLDSKETKNG